MILQVKSGYTCFIKQFLTLNIEIKKAIIEDLPVIVEIYNQAIRQKFATADTILFTPEERLDWFKSHTAEYPVYVAWKDNKIVGWLSVSPYRPGRLALRTVKEVSYYIDNKYQRLGIGSALLQCAIQKAKDLDVENYIAIVLEKNLASISLLQKFGFQLWGHLPMVAHFESEKCGHLYYGLCVIKSSTTPVQQC
jgi:L-amino acid N-acyltransferase YncA